MVRDQDLNLEKLPGQVEFCLDKYPLSRNDDYELLACVAEEFYAERLEMPVETVRGAIWSIYRLPKLNDVARSRRQVIEKYKYRKYLPTNKDVAKRRKISTRKYNKYMKELGEETVWEYMDEEKPVEKRTMAPRGDNQKYKLVARSSDENMVYEELDNQ